MALFKRNVLKEKGLTEEQIEYLMTESNRALAADYLPKSEMQAKIDAAVLEATHNTPTTITESEEYKALEQEFNNFKTKVEKTVELKKGGVKDKFFDHVYSLLDINKPVEEQLTTIREQYEEYFDPTESLLSPSAPQFGAEVKGKMPSGKPGFTFEDVWLGNRKG